MYVLISVILISKLIIILFLYIICFVPCILMRCFNYFVFQESDRMDPFNDGDNLHIEDIVLENVETTSSKKKKVTGRGPSRPVNSSTPMFLEFDEYDLPTGDWVDKYGKQIGQCALRIDINAPKWNKVDQSIKDRMWAETQV